MEGGIAENLNLVEASKVSKKKQSLPSLGQELNEAAEQIDKQQKEVFVNQNLAQYSIKGSDSEWDKALSKNKLGLVSVKTGEKRPGEGLDEDVPEMKQRKKKKKGDKENQKKKKH